MTRLSRPVRRTVPPASRLGHPRPLVVTLTPAVGDHEATIEVREHRTRKGYTITLPALYVVLAMRAVVPRKRARRGTRLGAA